MVNSRAVVGVRRRRQFYKWVMDLVGTDTWGDREGRPPEPKALRWRWEGRTFVKLPKDQILRHEYQVVTANNDGSEVWFGWNDAWKNHMNAREVRALTWWLLWEWYAKARWFGLRRPIYYWALNRHVNRFNRQPIDKEQ